MKKVNVTILLMFIVSVLLLMIRSSCNKDDDYDVFAHITFNPSITYGSFTDQDGNTYKTVTIGSQVWMAENLKTTKYRNGDEIPNVTDATQWGNLTTGAYCNYDDDMAYVNIYGRLYNWYAVDDKRNIAPFGWHVPFNEEWIILTDYLGGQIAAGGKLKEIGLTHWKNGNIGANNESGFTALPGGSRYYNNYTFKYIGLIGSWWSASATDSTSAWIREINCNFANVDGTNPPKQFGYSVRCIKD